MNNKYLGLTIGPIIKTLSMARKPRELWSASYLFSFLMETLITQFKPHVTILSPAEVKNDQDKRVGLYPDRLFCKYDRSLDALALVKEVKERLAVEIQIDTNYFNIYMIEIEAVTDKDAIKELNERLNFLELQNPALNNGEERKIQELISKNYNSKLFEIALKKRSFPIETLAEIASVQLKQKNETLYNKCLDGKEKEEDQLIKNLRDSFRTEFQTPHKYICIVHADGDNMGSIVNSLEDGKLSVLSGQLLSFGKQACEQIRTFGGLPIYAGGDDLLFIAPVISGKEKTQTIFDLLMQIDQAFDQNGITQYKADGKTPSMSYGISITYYKYPLYEGLELSRNLLFNIAKNICPEKNAIAWTLQKGSGSAVSGAFSKTHGEIKKAFFDLIESILVDDNKQQNTFDKNLISVVAHKIRSSEFLLELCMDKQEKDDRLKAFFSKTLEYDSKTTQEQTYLKAVQRLLKALYPKCRDIKETTGNTYAMLRTAKFIKGLEEDKNE